MNNNDKIDTQRYVDDHLFVDWWIKLIELTKKLEDDLFLDVFYIRYFFIILYELLVSGKVYSTYAKTWNSEDPKYILFDELHTRLSDVITEDDFFMINYYRNSACHIFVSHYSWLNSYNSDKIKPENKQMKFKRKDGSDYYLSQEEIRSIAKRVIGKYGTSEEIYKRDLFSRLSPIILPKNTNDND